MWPASKSEDALGSRGKKALSTGPAPVTPCPTAALRLSDSPTTLRGQGALTPSYIRKQRFWMGKQKHTVQVGRTDTPREESRRLLSHEPVCFWMSRKKHTDAHVQSLRPQASEPDQQSF